MPYIKQEDRDRLDQFIDTLKVRIRNPGDLNYVISRLALDFAYMQGANYAAFNATIGVMEAAKLEFYRTRVAPYEDRKIEENGDI